MIAWLISSLTCLLVVDLTVPSPRCRLVWRGEERAVFIPGSVLAICRLVLVLVVPSRRRGSYPLRLASMSCPSCLILFACYHYLVSSCVSFLISSGVSLRSSCLRCVFLVYFSPRSREACDCLICSRARLVSSSRHPVSSCVSGGGGSSCVACLICPDGVLSYRPIVSSDGTGSGAVR